MAWITDNLRAAIGAVSRLSPFGRAETALPGIFTHQLALAAYMSSGMLRKVIKIPAADRTREWRDWQAEKEAIAVIEAEEKRLGLRAKVKHAEILRGIGGGALIMITAGDHSKPLDPETISEGGLVAVNVASRWEITAKDFDRDLASPTYREPRMFEVSSDGHQTDLHPSRVICFRGDPIPAGAAVSDEEAFWGDSRLLQVYPSVVRSDNAKDWFAALVKKAKLLRFGIPNLDEMDPATLGKRIEVIALGEGSLNATVYRSSGGADDAGEKIDDYQVTWTGMPEMMDAFDQDTAATSDIPFTRLTGRSPAGMNATGKSDADNWNSTVADGQENETRPCLEKLDPVLIRSAGLDPKDIWWVFAPLDTPSEKEVAETFKIVMEAVTSLMNTGLVPEEALSRAVQNLLEERGYLPGLADALKLIPEELRFGVRSEPDEDDDDPSALKGGDPESGGGGKAPPAGRPTTDAWMTEDWAAKPLYVRRDVLNRADIVRWAQAQGFTDVVEDLHVTITYSCTPVDWMAMGESWRGKLEIEAGGPRLVEALGPDGEYKALLFTAYELISRNQEMRDKGASFDWPEYQPHISIQLGGDLDLAGVEPYRGKIVLGPEIFEEIRA